MKPKVICLCGSSRFSEAFAVANMHETLMGNIVVSMGMFGHADVPQGAKFLVSDAEESDPNKRKVDELHLRKIDLADEILIINVGGYYGNSTTREISYAKVNGKPVRFMFPVEESQDALGDQHDTLWPACSMWRFLVWLV